MPPDSNDYNNLERQRELIQEQEALRLRQEERRIRAAKRQSKFAWVRNTILMLVGALQILLALRFFLRLTTANPDNMFARFIFNLSDPFVAPFATLFISPASADASRIFDLNTLTAMFVYALLSSLAIAGLNYLQGRQP